MFKGKVDVSQGAFTSSDPFSRPDSDCAELVWENGQIMMQGEAKQRSNSNNFQTIDHKPQHSRNDKCSKMTKFSTMDPVMVDLPMLVPSLETGLDQDVDTVVPWMSYPMEEPLHHNEFTTDFFQDLSGVTMNNLPTGNHLGFRKRKSSFLGDNGHDSFVSLKHGITSKVCSRNEKDNRGESSEGPQLLFPFQHNASRSGVPDINDNNVRNSHHFASRDSMVNPVNFDCGCSRKERVSQNQFNMARANEKSDPLPTNPAKELFSANQPLLREDISKHIGSQNQPCDRPMSKMVPSGERSIEPVIASSSLCSASKPTRNLKRIAPETEESSRPSEEFEDESVSRKKHFSARPCFKRSRVSEVHNISERRRRDKINKKMRELQDLIPNCNKADKASMLDEAIEYLKTLQLQLQILSMGAGMYMHPMILPPAMQPMQGVHLPHFAPMGLGMGLRLGFGINMLNMNNAAKMVPFHGLHYPFLFPGIQGPTLQAFPHSGQGLPMSMQSAGLLKMPIGLNGLSVSETSNSSHFAPSCDKKDSNPQAMPNSTACNYFNQENNQASNVGIQQSAFRRDQLQGLDLSKRTTEHSGGKDDFHR